MPRSIFDIAGDQARRRAAQDAAQQASEFGADPGYALGFASSAISALPELIGMDPSSTAARFRQENPIGGFASQLIGFGGPYAAAYRLSRLPRAAAALEGAVGRFGIDAAARPLLHGAVTEMVRYAPLEMTRLAGGALFAPEENMGDLFADVALSTAITGGLGGLGGLFRAGGKVGAAGPGRVVGADFRLAPTAELRLGLREGAQANAGELGERLSQLRAEVLTEVAPKIGAASQRHDYLMGLEGGTAEEVAGLRSLFRPNSAANKARAVDRRLMLETPPENFRGINPGEQQEVIAALGLPDLDTFLSHAFLPRVVTAASERGAGIIGRLLESQGLQSVGEGTLMGMESNGGQTIIIKRIRSPRSGVLAERARLLEERKAAIGTTGGRVSTKGLPQAPKAYGKAGIAAGDRFVVLKTDRPELFAPEAALVGRQTQAVWANWAQQWKPQGTDWVNRGADQMLMSMTPLDVQDMQRLGRKTWISQFSKRYTQKAVDAAGLTDSLLAKQVGEWAWDTFAPAMFQEGRNTLFGRFFGLYRNGVRMGDEYLNHIMRGKAKFEGTPVKAMLGSMSFTEGFAGHRPVETILKDLTEDELGLVYRAAVTQTPAEELGKLVANPELLSPLAKAAVSELQAINKTVIGDLVMPVLDNVRMRERFNFLEGYILPRLWRGDYRMPVVDETGREVYLASGRNAGEAMQEARAVIAEARGRGINLAQGKGGLAHITELDVDELGRITSSAASRLGNDAEMMDVVQTALRQINILKSTTGKRPTIPGNPSTLKARTGRAGTPDNWSPTHGEVARQVEAHYRQLLRFSNDLSWRERWGQAALRWGQEDPTAYNNLMRKANQYVGIEGQITNTLNKTLQPLLGPLLGSKPATRIAQKANELMYDMQLAILNPTFALLNLLTPLQTVAPWVAYSTRASRPEVERTMGLSLLMDNAGKVQGSAYRMEPLKVLGQAMKMARNPSAEERAMMEQAVNDNTLKAHLFEEWVGGDSSSVVTMKSAYKQGGFVEFARTGLKWMANKSESVSRLVAFNSGILVGRDHFGLQGDALYRFAKRATEVTMYNYGTVDRARIMTGPVGSMFGLFKNWQMHFMGNMINYAGIGWKEGVWSPLLWQMAAATALGGLGATPLRRLADGLANHYEDKSSFLWLKEHWPNAADEVYFGLPAFLGVSLQASSAMPGTDVRNEVGSMANFVAWERAKQLGSALGDGWRIQQATGENMLRDPNVRDQIIQSTMPRAVSRIASALEGDYIRSMRTGYPQVRGLSPSDRVMYGLGFNLTNIEQYQVAGKELWRRQEDRKAAVSGIGQEFAQAQLAGDSDHMTQLIQRAIAMGLPVSSVLASSRTVAGRESQGDVLSRYDAAQTQQYINALHRGR